MLMRLCLMVLLSMTLLPWGVGLAAPRESVVYVDGAGPVYRMNPDGTQRKQLVAAFVQPPSRTLPARDGLTVLSYSGLLTSSAPDGNASIGVTPAGYTLTSGYAYSPDGTRLAFTGKTAAQTFYAVHTMNADGSGSPVQLATPTTNEMVLDWGTPGVLFRDQDPVTKAMTLWRVDPVTLVRTEVGPAHFNVMDARYSADNLSIAMVGQYQGATSGNRIYTMNADGTGVVELSTGSVTLVPNAIAWSMDGTRVAVSAYPLGGDGIYRIYAVTLASGVATVIATNQGTGSPTRYVYWGLLEDPLSATQTVVANVTASYGGTALLQATLTSGGSGVGGKSLSFSVGGAAVGSAVTDAAGVATLAYPVGQGAGEYAVQATFAGDATHGASSGGGILSVTAATGRLSYSGDLVATGGTFMLRGRLSVTAGSVLNAGSLQFVLSQGATTVGTYTAPIDSTGVGTVTLPGLAAAAYTVSVSLPANPYYTAAPVTAAVKAGTSLTVADTSGQYADVQNLTATLTSGGSPVAGKTVSFSVSGSAVGTAVTDGAGVASLAYTVSQGAGSYPVTAAFSGDATYASASGSGTLTVAARPATLAYSGDTVANGGPFVLKATVTATAGNITLAGPVTFVLTQGATTVGTYTGAVDATGTATVNLPSLASANYTVTVSISSHYYTAPAVSANVRAGTQLTVTSLTVTYGSTATLQATLSVAGAPVVGKTINFSVGATAVGTAVADAAGVATLAYPVGQGAGSYPVTAAFTGDATYDASNGSGTLTVTQAPGTLSYTGDTAASGGAFVLKGVLAVSAGTVTNAGSLQFVIKQGATVVGTYTGTVDATGTATVNLASLAAGAYTVTLSLPANAYYTASPVTATIKSATALAVSSLSGQYSDPVTLQATLTAGGVGVAGRTVGFMVNGAAVGTGTTNGAGLATLLYTVTLPAASYPIQAEFAGDATYPAASGTATLTVTQENATLAYTGSTTTAGGPLSLGASLTQAADGSPGDITLAGSVQWVVTNALTSAVVGTYSGTVNGGGSASAVTGGLQDVPHTVQTSLLANGYFQASAVTTTIKGSPSLAAQDASGQYSDPVTLLATLTGGAGAMSGRTVAFSVGGTLVGTAITDASGVASLSYTIAQPAGSYTVQATFAGDSLWIGATGSGTLTVAAETGMIAYTGPALMQPGAITLSALFTQAADGSPGDTTNASLSFTAFNATTGTTTGPWTAGMNAVGSAATTLTLPEGQYTITITMVGGGYFTASNASGSLIVDGTPPSTPPAPTVTLISCLVARVTWTASTDNLSGVATYQVYRSVNGGAMAWLTTVGAGTTTITDTDIVPSTAYRYAVVATDQAGNSSPVGGVSSSITQNPCAAISNTLFTRSNFQSVTTTFDVTAPQTYVNIRYRVYLKGTSTLVREFWAFGTGTANAQLYPGVGTFVQETIWNGQTNPGPGKYTFVSQIWYGATPAAMYANPATDSKNIKIN